MARPSPPAPRRGGDCGPRWPRPRKGHDGRGRSAHSAASPSRWSASGTPSTAPDPAFDRGAPPVGDVPAFAATPAGVRAALETVVAHGAGGVAPAHYEAALAMLGRLPPVSGHLGEAMAAVLQSPRDP